MSSIGMNIFLAYDQFFSWFRLILLDMSFLTRSAICEGHQKEKKMKVFFNKKAAKNPSNRCQHLFRKQKWRLLASFRVAALKLFEVLTFCRPKRDWTLELYQSRPGTITLDMVVPGLTLLTTRMMKC